MRTKEQIERLKGAASEAAAAKPVARKTRTAAK